MRISDWSSDVCSSDLSGVTAAGRVLMSLWVKTDSGQTLSSVNVAMDLAGGSAGENPSLRLQTTATPAGRMLVDGSGLGGAALTADTLTQDRTSVGTGKSVSYRLALGGGSSMKK